MQSTYASSSTSRGERNGIQKGDYQHGESKSGYCCGYALPKENANNEKDCAHQRSEHYEVDSRTSVHWITPNIAEYNQSGTIAASPKPISHHADHYPSREGSGRHLRHSTTDRMRIDPRNSLLESVPSVP